MSNLKPLTKKVYFCWCEKITKTGEQEMTSSVLKYINIEVEIVWHIFFVTDFVQLGFFNEADTLESSLILLYSFQEQSIYTQKRWQKAILIKMGDNLKKLQFNQGNLIKGGNTQGAKLEILGKTPNWYRSKTSLRVCALQCLGQLNFLIKG